MSNRNVVAEIQALVTVLCSRFKQTEEFLGSRYFLSLFKMKGFVGSSLSAGFVNEMRLTWMGSRLLAIALGFPCTSFPQRRRSTEVRTRTGLGMLMNVNL